MDNNLVIFLVSEAITAIIAIGGAWVAVKTLLAQHEERFKSHGDKFDRIERDIEEIKEERRAIHNDLKDLQILMNKVYGKVGILDERTKRD